MIGNGILVAHAIEGVLWIGVLGVVLYLPWQKVCVDYARDIIFEERDKLFDIAASGKIGFDSPQYEKMRTAMNAMIRLAHSFTVPRMFTCIYMMRRLPQRTDRQDLLNMIQQIEDMEVRNAFSEALQRIESIIVLMMLLRSPLTIFGALIFVKPFLSVRRRVEKFMARPLEATIGHEIQGTAL